MTTGARPHVVNNSGDFEWYTPKVLTDAAKVVMGGIDLDPASSELANKSVGAEQYFTAETNGLARKWKGRVWLNPPYARGLMDDFCDKLAEEVRAGRVDQAVVLTNNATETGWFHTLLAVSSGMCLLRGRVKFWHPERAETRSPVQGQTITYVGENLPGFRSVFSSLGSIVTVEHPTAPIVPTQRAVTSGDLHLLYAGVE
jgi:phage N-6-adenine-methyltransferase